MNPRGAHSVMPRGRPPWTPEAGDTRERAQRPSPSDPRRRPRRAGRGRRLAGRQHRRHPRARAPARGGSDELAASPRPGDARRDRRACWPPPWPATSRFWSTARSASAATPRPCSGPAPRRSWSASTAIPERWPWRRTRLAPFGDRVTLVEAVYDELPEVLARLGRPTGAGRPARPRSLVAADRRPRARVRVRVRRPAGHADGPSGADRRRGRQHLRRRPTWPGFCAATARSGSPTGSPGGSWPNGPGSRSRRPAGWCGCSATRCR